MRVNAVSRPAAIANPWVRLGFLTLRGHERAVFLSTTARRMCELTAAGLGRGDRSARIRDANDEFTARFSRDRGAHDALADQVQEPRG